MQLSGPTFIPIASQLFLYMYTIRYPIILSRFFWTLWWGGGGPYVILYSPGSLICMMCITLYMSSFLDFPLASCDVVILGGLASKIISHIRSNSLSNLLYTKTGVCAVLHVWVGIKVYIELFIYYFLFLSFSFFFGLFNLFLVGAKKGRE